MKSLSVAAILLALLLPACATTSNPSEREWQMAECNRVLDDKAREKCVSRVQSEYGRR